MGNGKEERRTDENFTELLSKFRVAQQGIQFLFAFLLTVPFTVRFTNLDTYQKWVYAAALLSATFSSVLFIAPVSHHLLLIHQGLKGAIVDFASKLGSVALVLMLISMLASVFLITDMVFGLIIAWVFVALGLVCAVVFWYAVPLQFKKEK